MNDALLIFAGFVAHAWIGKISGPPGPVNTVAWVVGALLTVILLWYLLVNLGILRS